jgi:hypothetical protein
MSNVYSVLTANGVYDIEATSAIEAEGLLANGGHQVVVAARRLPPVATKPGYQRIWDAATVTLRTGSLFK